MTVCMKVTTIIRTSVKLDLCKLTSNHVTATVADQTGSDKYRKNKHIKVSCLKSLIDARQVPLQKTIIGQEQPQGLG